MRTMNRIKVAQFGLGPIGLEALKLAAEQPWLEVVGAVDHARGKSGRPLAEISGVAALDGLRVVPTLEELFRNGAPQVLLHAASSRAGTTLAQLRPALELGVSVVTTCEELIFPARRHPELAREVDGQCRRTGARLVAAGVNPGFVMDLLPVCLTGVCREVESIRIERVVDAGTRRQPLQAKIGSGQEPAGFARRLSAGEAGHAGLGESLALVAHAMGWRLETITERATPVVAARELRTAFFTVAPGQVCGIHQHARGTVAGRERIALDLQMYLGAPAPHDRVIIRGQPDLDLTLPGGIAGDTATVAALVNTVPRLLAASPGLRLLTELALPAWPGALRS